jgi:hypothetical protein
LIIAIDMLKEVRKYDFSVLQPINYQMIVMLEYGLLYFPQSLRIKSWLTKLYGKLGLPSLVQQHSEDFPTVPASLFTNPDEEID